VGVPIKSSALYTKPTLTYLEKQFVQHQESRLAFKPDLKTRIDQVLAIGKYNEQTFAEALKKQGIAVVFLRSGGGQTYGITFVDHHNKTVFNGSDLGKNYTAKSITGQFTQGPSSQQLTKSSPLLTAHHQKTPNQISIPENKAPSVSMLDALLKADQDHNSFLPKRKRRKKKINL
jgi:hypothetical protein